MHQGGQPPGNVGNAQRFGSGHIVNAAGPLPQYGGRGPGDIFPGNECATPLPRRSADHARGVEFVPGTCRGKRRYEGRCKGRPSRAGIPRSDSDRGRRDISSPERLLEGTDRRRVLHPPAQPPETRSCAAARARPARRMQKPPAPCRLPRTRPSMLPVRQSRREPSRLPPASARAAGYESSSVDRCPSRASNSAVRRATRPEAPVIRITPEQDVFVLSLRTDASASSVIVSRRSSGLLVGGGGPPARGGW